MEHTAAELHVYQKNRRRSARRDANAIPEFDAFIADVSLLFKLRSEAEDNFKRNPHLARSKNKALPLDWVQINAILDPEKNAPPETLLTRIARECVGEVESLVCDLRKVLVRERNKVSLGMAQQVDAHCLRWLTRQPGRDAVEKAGARQKILAVVRRENFNTLENRVFKDFLERASEATWHYLKSNKDKFSQHQTIKTVNRLYKLTKEGLGMPVMETINDLFELPMPNYVLRQERRYSKIWKNYCQLVREGDIAERLWNRKDELVDMLYQLLTEVPSHTSPNARYHHPIWFNYIDGKQEFLDKPFYKNKTGAIPVKSIFPKNDADDLVVIDLTGRQPCCDLLIYGCHKNAKPYLQSYDKPSIEDIENKDSRFYFLRDLIRDAENPFPVVILRDYFEQLRAVTGGKRWLVLVPDEWNALRQEEILRSMPLPRDKVTLLWRSIAAVIGARGHLKNAKLNDTVGIIDCQQNGKINYSVLALIERDGEGFLIPQRKSYERATGERYLVNQIEVSSQNFTNEERYLQGRHNGELRECENLNAVFSAARPRQFLTNTHTVFIGKFNDAQKTSFCAHAAIGQIVVFEDEQSFLKKGARIFDAKRLVGEIAYYDELEALSLIIQTRDERVVAEELVAADEKFPGGRQTAVIANDDVSVRKGEDNLLFLLCQGKAIANAPLKELKIELPEAPEQDERLHIEAKMTPGQGMAIATVSASFLANPVVLDFLKMTASLETIASMENKMQRSFPPDSPDVIADNCLWHEVEDAVEQYMSDMAEPDGTWFARAANIYNSRDELPYGASPLELLRRKNVFGNGKGRRYPRTSNNFSFDGFFKRLASNYNNTFGNERFAIIRSVAWTYQHDNPMFNQMKRDALQGIMDFAKGYGYTGPRPQEYTLCANLCATPAEWLECFRAIYLRLANHDDKVSEYLRLLYNLLQFHPNLIRDTKLYECGKCWSIMQFLPKWYERNRMNSQQIGYVLKSMLYLLRCRRFDGKRFLTQEHDPEHYQIIADCLSMRVYHTKEPLRQLVLKYLNGKGTIDGLPTD